MLPQCPLGMITAIVTIVNIVVVNNYYNNYNNYNIILGLLPSSPSCPPGHVPTLSPASDPVGHAGPPPSLGSARFCVCVGPSLNPRRTAWGPGLLS